MTSRFFRKLGFVHRQLWWRNRLYQISVLAGPAPLLGILLAGAVWAAGSGIPGRSAPPPWAKPEPREVWSSADGPISSVLPSAPLPLIDADGNLAGYKPGWRMATQRLELLPGYAVNTVGPALTGVTIEGARIDMDQIIAGGPKEGLYAAFGQGFLVIQDAGTYNLSARFERPPAEPASCLIRMGFGPRRVVSHVDLSLINQVSTTFDPVQFVLKPGLYLINWTLGCWHDQAVRAPGSVTVLIGRPADSSLQPVRSSDIVHREGNLSTR